MAGPITWRNVGGGGMGGVPALLHMGQQQIQQGLSALSGLMGDNQKMQRQNFLVSRDNNTEAYLDEVASAGGLEALQNPEIRAQLEASRKSRGAIDLGATRNAIDERITGLQRAAVASGAYQDQQTERDQRPVLEQVYEAARNNDRAKTNELFANNNLLNEGKVAADIDSVFDAATRRTYAAEDQARQGRQEVRSAAQFAESMANAKENRADRQTARQEKRDFNMLTAMEEQLKGQSAAISASNPLLPSKDPIGDANAAVKKVAGSIDPWTDDANTAVNALTDRITSYMGTGRDIQGLGKVKLPTAVMEQFLTEAAGESFQSTDTMLTYMDTWVDSYITKNAGAFQQAAKAQEQLKNLNAVKNSLQENRIRLLKGESLDSKTFSDTLNSARKKAPGLNLVPSQDTGGYADERTIDSMSYRPDGSLWGS